MSPRDLPSFVKPVVPKQCAAGVYETTEALEAATRGLGAETEVIVSEMVSFVAEARAFVLDGAVQTLALYEGDGDLEQLGRFAAFTCGMMKLPRTCVIDFGRLAD